MPHLKAQGGSVINISATLPYLGTMGQAHASAAKAGVDSLTRTLAVEWGPYGIRVNGIAPGPIDGTEGVRRLDQRELARKRPSAGARWAGWGRWTISRTPPCTRRSDAASYVNGVTLVVDGGLWLRSARMLGEE